MYTALLYTTDREKASEEIESLHGQLLQILTPTIFMADLPDQVDVKNLSYSTAAIPPDIDDLSTSFVRAFQNFRTPREGEIASPPPGTELPRNASNDAMLRLEAEIYPPDTSSYLMGGVAVGLVIVGGPNALAFTMEEIDKIKTQVMQGLKALQDFEPAAGITFHYETCELSLAVVPPVSPCLDYESCESIWRNPALKMLGCSPGLLGVYEYNNRLIQGNQGCRWGFTAFFTKYPLYHFAYAADGRICMQYSNGPWGPDQIDRVFAHETAHVFGAADEYVDSSTTCTCDNSGYYRVPNYNCDACNTSPFTKTPCLVKNNDLDKICFWSRSQLGWPFWRNGATDLTGQTTGGPITLSVFNNSLYLIYGDVNDPTIWVTISQDGLNWTNTQVIPNQGCSTAASSVVRNNKLWLAYKDNTSAQLWITSIDQGSSKWNAAVRISGQSTNGPIALSVFNTKLYLIYGDNHSSALWVTSSADGSNWGNTYSIRNVACKVAASSIVHKDKLWLVYEANDSPQLWLISMDINNTWSQPQMIPGQYTGGPVTLSVYNDRLYLIYGDSNDPKIWVTTFYNEKLWVNTQAIPYQGCSAAASSAVYNGQLWLVYKDNTNTNKLWSTSLFTNT